MDLIQCYTGRATFNLNEQEEKVIDECFMKHAFDYRNYTQQEINDRVKLIKDVSDESSTFVLDGKPILWMSKRDFQIEGLSSKITIYYKEL